MFVFPAGSTALPRPAREAAIIPFLACLSRLGTRARSIGLKSILNQPECLRASGEEQIPKRPPADRARDLVNAEEGDQRDEEDRAHRQESRERAAAEVGH